MSKFVYRYGDEVMVKLGGTIYYLTIASSEVEDPDPLSGESVIHYVATDGTQFTDQDIQD